MADHIEKITTRYNDAFAHTPTQALWILSISSVIATTCESVFVFPSSLAWIV
jgi:hypothetical protein